MEHLHQQKSHLLRVVDHVDILTAKLLAVQFVQPIPDLCQGRDLGLLVDVFFLIFKVRLEHKHRDGSRQFLLYFYICAK